MAAWEGSNRSERLPDDWDSVCKPESLKRNPRRVCHWCGRPGGDELDHLVAGDDHSVDNRDWIHGRRAFEAGLSAQNCHAEKSGREGAAARAAKMRRWREPEIHPGLR